MPIVNIDYLLPRNPRQITSMLAEIRQAGAAALACAPDNIWVNFEPRAGEQLLSAAPHPPIVLIQANAGRTAGQREAFVAAVAGAVARGLSVAAEKVWIHYHELQPEDIWFGGRWVTARAENPPAGP